MPDFLIHHNALVLVGDGRKALFLRNRGTPQALDLVVEEILDGSDNPPTREQGTDRPGRVMQSAGFSRSSVEQTDWHLLEEQKFAGTIAEALYKAAMANSFSELVIVAPPKTLGTLRQSFHKQVSDRIQGEMTKTLTSAPIDEISRLLAA
ncbi:MULTISPECIES: host attachment family protein [Kaistia]|uniref:Host attachment family protein n=1 Tax=Kaistia nematophila TaxID=2994654 RepID=A0A9X3ECS6_9HYPH|nr:host attachment family protein [Kaistia nematophila]MBN9059193.1 host attachment protein [Hyphomicrobiales bacterium]MCX5570565.1 host attachment family protein [Kaistia nematophila]